MPRKPTDVAVPRGPKWRKLEIVAWTDSTVRGLSAPQPNAQTLWHYLLTGPRTTTFPGLVVARQAVLASDLGWSGEAFREVFLELCTAGLIEADEQGGVVLLRKALFNGPKHDRLSVRESARPESPNALKGWAKSWSEVPDSHLKDKYLSLLGAFAEALGEAYREAYREGFAKALAKATRTLPGTFEDTYPKASSNQEKEKEKEINTDGPASPTPVVASPSQPVDPKPKRTKPDPSTDAREVAERLAQHLLAKQPDHRNARNATTVRGWAEAIDQAIRLDGREKSKLLAMLDWVFTKQTASARFVVESGSALREKYDAIARAANAQRDLPSANSPAPRQLTRDFGDDFTDPYADDPVMAGAS